MVAAEEEKKGDPFSLFKMFRFMSKTLEDSTCGGIMQLAVMFSVMNTLLYMLIVAYLMLQTSDLRQHGVHDFEHI
ncbi:hypothetical protein MTO96_004412 [Rhipicephalus appendiculatus]